MKVVQNARRIEQGRVEYFVCDLHVYIFTHHRADDLVGAVQNLERIL